MLTALPAQTYASLMSLHVDSNLSTLELVAGADDDQAGIRISVDGDAYPRTILLPDGSILRGNGTAPAEEPTVFDQTAADALYTPLSVGVGDYITLAVTSFALNDDGSTTATVFDTTVHLDAETFSFNGTDTITVLRDGVYTFRSQVRAGGTAPKITFGQESGAQFSEVIELSATKVTLTDTMILSAGDTIDTYVGVTAVGSVATINMRITKIA